MLVGADTGSCEKGGASAECAGPGQLAPEGSARAGGGHKSRLEEQHRPPPACTLLPLLAHDCFVQFSEQFSQACARATVHQRCWLALRQAPSTPPAVRWPESVATSLTNGRRGRGSGLRPQQAPFGLVVVADSGAQHGRHRAGCADACLAHSQPPAHPLRNVRRRQRGVCSCATRKVASACFLNQAEHVQHAALEESALLMAPRAFSTGATPAQPAALSDTKQPCEMQGTDCSLGPC